MHQCLVTSKNFGCSDLQASRDRQHHICPTRLHISCCQRPGMELAQTLSTGDYEEFFAAVVTELLPSTTASAASTNVEPASNSNNPAMEALLWRSVVLHKTWWCHMTLKLQLAVSPHQLLRRMHSR